MSHYYAENQSPPHFYSPSLQLKLYNGFIFSIPILFSIVLFLLLYLFYLRRRADPSPSSTQPLPPATYSSRSSSFVPPPHLSCLKGDPEETLAVVQFDEDLKSRGLQCCVCLGEFEMREEVHQVPSCGHVFHVVCLHHWLHSHTTCPLCRGPIAPSANLWDHLPALPPFTHPQNPFQFHQTHTAMPSNHLHQQSPHIEPHAPAVDNGSSGNG